MPKTGIIILAAGNSSRLGRPKQLLPYRGRTLIGYLVDEAAVAGLSPIVVVTGAVDLSAALAGRRAEMVENPGWSSGMASSIVSGVSAVTGAEMSGGNSKIGQEVESVIIAACDQPHVTAGLFRRLVATWVNMGKGIVVCSYAGTTGIPVMFDRRYFPDLLALSGAEGAKKVVQRFAPDVAEVIFEAGAIDIDTEEDYARLSGV